MTLNPNHLKRDEQFLEQHKSKIIKISDRKIKALKIEMNWDGNGSKLDPIVIDQVGTLPLSIKISRSRLYYHIKNLTIGKLTCCNAKNINIENCIIKHLKIEGCENLTLLNNTVLKLKIAFTRGSTFIDNKFAQMDKLKQNYYTIQGNPIVRQVSNPLTCCLCFTSISMLVSGTSIWFIGLIPFGVLIFFNYSSYVKNKKIQDKPDNTYINNIGV